MNKYDKNPQIFYSIRKKNLLNSQIHINEKAKIHSFLCYNINKILIFFIEFERSK